MDFELTDEQRLIRESARDFSREVIAPKARDNNREHKFDLDLVARIAEQGYLGAIVPREYGGPGLDYLSYGFIVEEVGRACSGMRTVVSVQTSLVASAILKWGSEEQKHAFLPDLCSGAKLGCFGLTEPDTGSDAANQRTRATQREDGTWVINGAKMWISLGDYADVALIFAQTDPDKGYKGLACFLVDTDQDGFQPTPIHGKMGMHAVDTAAISLIDVECTEMLGEIGDGFKVAMTALESGRYSVAAGSVGIAEGCIAESTSYAKEREQFGRPLASFQLINAKIADMRVRTDAARMLVWRAAWLKDTGQPNSTETSIAKYFCTETAVWAANEAIQIHGGAGYVDDHPVERYFRDARVTTLYEGTSQIQQLIIGRAETGINAMVPA